MAKLETILVGVSSKVQQEGSAGKSEALKEESSLFDNILQNIQEGSSNEAEDLSTQDTITKQNSSNSLSNKQSKNIKESDSNITEESSKQTITSVETGVLNEEKEQNVKVKSYDNIIVKTDANKNMQESATNYVKADIDIQLPQNNMSLLDRMIIEVSSSNENKTEQLQVTAQQTVKNADTKSIENDIVKSDNLSINIEATSTNDTNNIKEPNRIVTKDVFETKQTIGESKATADNISDVIKPNVKQTQSEDKSKSIVTKDSEKDTFINKDIIKQTIPQNNNSKISIIQADEDNVKQNYKSEKEITANINSTTIQVNISEQSDNETNRKEVEKVVNRNDERSTTSKIQNSEIDTNINIDINKNSDEEETDLKQNIKTEVKKADNAKLGKTDTKVLYNEIDNDFVADSKDNIKTTNSKAAKEFAALNDKDTNEIRVDISKDDILTKSKEPNTSKDSEILKKNELLQEQTKGKNSLLDKLVDESIKLSTKKAEGEIKAVNLTLDKNEQQLKDPLLTSIYISSREKIAKVANIQTKSEGKKIASQAKNVDDIRKSSKVLDLGLQDTQIIQEESEEQKIYKKDFLNRLAFAQNSMQKTFKNINDNIIIKSETTNANQNEVAASTLTSKSIEINVAPQAIQTFESRVIGARQRLGSFMSDVARQIYQNYKPPLTSFRINLLPANLGSIAITLKSERDNGISISLNMSSSTTLDTFVDNQASLRAALTRNFDGEANFSLDFGMQNQDGGNNSFEEQRQSSTKSDIKLVDNEINEEVQDVEDNSNYM